GATPISVAFATAAMRHRAVSSGWYGLPSIITIADPTTRPPTSAFHIIHAVVENQQNRLPGPRSKWRLWFFSVSSRIPPWLCTIAFGLPVVPEEKRMESGRAKCTDGNAEQCDGSPT